MPKRTDIGTICVLGAGPIVIGQACEFDYSGTQAVKALRSEGYRVVLVNSNPATIMTDPELADALVQEVPLLLVEVLGLGGDAAHVADDVTRQRRVRVHASRLLEDGHAGQVLNGNLDIAAAVCHNLAAKTRQHKKACKQTHVNKSFHSQFSPLRDLNCRYRSRLRGGHVGTRPTV